MARYYSQAADGYTVESTDNPEVVLRWCKEFRQVFDVHAGYIVDELCQPYRVVPTVWE